MKTVRTPEEVLCEVGKYLHELRHNPPTKWRSRGPRALAAEIRSMEEVMDLALAEQIDARKERDEAST